jgi:hypothetical protein
VHGTANIHSSANASVEGSFALLGGRDGVIRGARGGGQDGSQQRRHDSNIVSDAQAIVANWNVYNSQTGQAAWDEMGLLELRAVATERKAA